MKLKLDEYKEQTKHKHEYLKEYLATWFNILINHKTSSNMSFEKIIYVDSFSNAGEYITGEKGSPIIALNIFNDILKKHKNKKIIIECYFNDYDKERKEHLENLIKTLNLNEKIKIYCDNINANEHIFKVMEKIEQYNNKKALFFIDPYKIANDVISMQSLNKILKDKDTEVIFNHMVNDVVRNIKHYPEKYQDFYRINKNEQKKANEFNNIFIENIKKENNIKLFTSSYEFLNSKGQTIYFLVFITHHVKGFEKIKEDIWRVSKGDLIHKNKGSSNNFNLSLFPDENIKELREFKIKNKVEDLKDILLNQFKGKNVKYEEIKKFVIEETIFTSGQIYRKALIPLEKEGKIKIIGKIMETSNYIFPENSEEKNEQK